MFMSSRPSPLDPQGSPCADDPRRIERSEQPERSERCEHTTDTGRTDLMRLTLPMALRDPGQKRLWRSVSRDARAVLGRLDARRHRARDDLSQREPAGPNDALRVAWLASTGASRHRAAVIATPAAKDTVDWARFCEGHRPSLVVDLGTRAEMRELNHCMRSSAPTVLKVGTVAFVPMVTADSRGFPKDEPIDEIAPHAVLRPLCLTVRPHPSSSAIGPQLKVLDHQMIWMRVPVERGDAIPPRMLLAVGDRLRAAGAACPESGIVFMSPDGDRRAQVFGMAWRLRRWLDRDDWIEADLPMLVEKLCLDLRAHLGADLIFHEEDLASLLAFGAQTLRVRRAQDGQRERSASSSEASGAGPVSDDGVLGAPEALKG